MKKKLLVISFLLLTRLCFSAPSNSISVPNSFNANTTISSSATNANNNEVQTKFNAHSHTDTTQTGTITSGVWQGTVIDELYGGTGFTTYTTGDLIYSSATNTLSKLGIGSAGQALVVSGGIPAWTNYTGATSIVTLGTITTGTWNGTDIASGYGGLGSNRIDFGSVSVTANSSAAVSFAFTFGSAPQVVATYSADPGGAFINELGVFSITTTGCSIGSAMETTQTIRWIAIGAE